MKTTRPRYLRQAALIAAAAVSAAAAALTPAAGAAASAAPGTAAGAKVMSFVPLQSQAQTGFAAAHHCAFWAAG